MTKKIELKGGSFTLSVLHLSDDDLDSMATFVKEKVKQAPAFFENAPLVVDISRLEKSIDFSELKSIIDAAGMVVVGITGCKAFETRNLAKEAGLAVLNSARQPQHKIKKPKEEEKEASEQSETPIQAETETNQTSTLFVQNHPVQPTSSVQSSEIEIKSAIGEQTENLPSIRSRIISTPVRSGQQVYAKDADLIVLSHVSAGAEIIADGCIHVYGILRGRAIAGASGNTDAYIFCQNLQPELVSVAGHYWISDTIPEKYVSRAVKISLDKDTLNIDYLTV